MPVKLPRTPYTGGVPFVHAPGCPSPWMCLCYPANPVPVADPEPVAADEAPQESACGYCGSTCGSDPDYGWCIDCKGV